MLCKTKTTRTGKLGQTGVEAKTPVIEKTTRPKCEKQYSLSSEHSDCIQVKNDSKPKCDVNENFSQVSNSSVTPQHSKIKEQMSFNMKIPEIFQLESYLLEKTSNLSNISSILFMLNKISFI